MKTNELLKLFEDENIKQNEISELLVKKLTQAGKKISVAESCTGGLVAGAITDISGASAVFDLSVCSYANHIKHKMLGVKEQTLSTYGAVSEKTAMEMARGVRLLANSDIGISTTGIAGPLGGSQYKPVGLVYVGISTKDKLYAQKLLLNEDTNFDRRKIRSLAVMGALFFAYRETDNL